MHMVLNMQMVVDSNQGWKHVQVVSKGYDSVGIDFLRDILHMQNWNKSRKVNERSLRVINMIHE